MQKHEGPPSPPHTDEQRQRTLTRKLLTVVGVLTAAVCVLLIKRSYL